jgi:hypothetical protein
MALSGNAVIGGDLTVNGNLAYVNVTSLVVEDPIISLGGGPNGNVLISDDGKDRGQALQYYKGSAKQAFAGWQNSTGKMLMASNVTISGEVVTVVDYGNTVVGGLEAATASVTGNVTVGNISGTLGSFTTVAGTLSTAAQPNITSVGTLSSLSVSGTATVGNVSTAGTISSTGTLTAGNLATGGTLSVGGNANVGNIGATNGVFTTVAGTLSTAAQPNITSVGNLSGLTVTGTTSLGNVGNVSITGGATGYVLTTDGTGNLTWSSTSSAVASAWKVDTTTIAFGSSATTTAMTLPANAIVDTVSVIVDTTFNGTAPSILVGKSGGTGQEYVGIGDASLKLADRFDCPSQLVASGSTTDIVIAYTADGSSAGSARVLITYAIPE